MEEKKFGSFCPSAGCEPHPVCFCRLRQKEVINIRTCRSLGSVCDLEIDDRSGRVLCLVVPAPGWLGWFPSRDQELFIPWSCVVQIGSDIILVDTDEKTCSKKSRCQARR